MLSIAAQKWLFLFLLAGLTVFLTTLVAQGQWVLPALCLGFGLFYVVGRLTRYTPEVWVLAFLCAGYFWGNRGFAQLHVGGIFVGELGIVALSGLFLLYLPYRHALPVRREPLGLVIFLLLAYTALRLPAELSNYGIVALRDAAMVYYALFFYFAQPIARDDASRLFLEKALGVIFTVAVALIAASLFFRESVLNAITLNGHPLIAIKPDLGATFLAAIMSWAIFRWWRHGHRLWLALALLALVFCILASSRAAFVALSVGLLIFALAGLPHLLRVFFIGFTCLGLAFAIDWVLVDGEARESQLFNVIDHGRSLVDWDGQATYTSHRAADSGDNNRFRLVWWRMVIEETTRHHLWWGQGMGADLATPFAEAYWWHLPPDFTARSPHGYAITIYGRLGLVGLVLLLTIGFMIVTSLWQSIRLTRQMGTPHDSLAWWTFASIIAASACFGVVLEGPMAAIPFWTMLGVARELLAQASNRS